ncbi:GntR family transcriptional regulator [Tengunoibacter tsumagoiensis]|uniref:GntR family transcriptional regulator n=1 Tax=Tengunoibacter tsumagoiensis TaxID=2014871 RepID=A0A402AA90_9CHLR|nr:GntR family transcriptional regulator [Tengunoibacter tsumagoiensis]GCE16083.1 GntR family transcriptional regulator [Tengunoibacter tsumagoiensis]
MSKDLEPLSIQKMPGYREAAYNAIKESILSGYFKYGEALVEEEIAAKLQVSRTPVREALAILQHEQLIAPRRGRGFHVRQMIREEFIELFVANEVVEPYLARLAALHATPEQIQDMKDTVISGRQCAMDKNVPGLLRAGRDFHRAMGNAAGNKVLTRFVIANEERTDLYLLNNGSIIDSKNLSQSNQEHEAIIHAIAQRDPEAAARLVIHHSQSVRDRLTIFFAERPL